MGEHISRKRFIFSCSGPCDTALSLQLKKLPQISQILTDVRACISPTESTDFTEFFPARKFCVNLWNLWENISSEREICGRTYQQKKIYFLMLWSLRYCSKFAVEKTPTDFTLSLQLKNSHRFHRFSQMLGCVYFPQNPQIAQNFSQQESSV